MNIELVKSSEADEIWPVIAEYVAHCLDDIRADCTAADLWQIVRSGNGYLIIAHDGNTIKGATIWRFETWLHGQVLKNLITVNVGDGRMKDWLPAMDDAARMLAKSGGADRFIWQGREAWGRIFRDAKKLATIYEMRV